VVFGPDGNLYVSSQNTNEIMRYNGKIGIPLPGPGKTGAVFTSADGSGLDRPAGLLFGPGVDPDQQDIYVVSINSETVVRINGATGDSLGDFVTAGSGGLSKPRSLTFGNTDPSTLAYIPDGGRTSSRQVGEAEQGALAQVANSETVSPRQSV